MTAQCMLIQLMDEPYTGGKPTYSLADRTGAVTNYPYTVPAGHILIWGIIEQTRLIPGILEQLRLYRDL